MSARAHVCVALLLLSTSVAGCLFGGGGDKKRAARAAQPATPTVDSSPSGVAMQSPAGAERSPAAEANESAAARAQQAVGASRMADAVVERALASEESAVDWPSVAELRLANPPPVSDASDLGAGSSRGQARGAGEPWNDDEHGVEQEVVEAEELQPGAPSGGDAAGVVNRSLELPDTAITAGGAVEVEPAGRNPAPLGDASGLDRKFAQRLRDNPGDLATHLDYQLLRYLADEPVPDLNAIAGLPPEDRELLTALLDGLTNFRNGIRADNNMLLSKKIRPLLELGLRLRSQADLSIKKIALCQKLQGFGMYRPLDGRFVAGTDSGAIVYCELGNVSSRQNERGEWESTLAQEAVLYTAEGGQPVLNNPRLSVPDVSRSRRQDFFVAQKIMLPPMLPIGRYILKVTVYDEQVKRVAEATVPIEMVAQLTPRQPENVAQPAGPERPEPAAADGRPIARRSDRTGSPEDAGVARPASVKRLGDDRRRREAIEDALTGARDGTAGDGDDAPFGDQ